MITFLILLMISIIALGIAIIILGIGGSIFLVFGADIIVAVFVLWLLFRKKKK